MYVHSTYIYKFDATMPQTTINFRLKYSVRLHMESEEGMYSALPLWLEQLTTIDNIDEGGILRSTFKINECKITSG